MLRAFQDFRLAILSGLVDEHGWIIEHTHPPYLGRVFSILGEASGISGEVAVRGLMKVRSELEQFVGEVWEAAYKQRDNTASRTHKLARARTTKRDALTALLGISPTGVLMALDRDTDRSWDDPSWPYVNIVPPELLDILRFDPKGRAAALA
jgi:hypothetical protein